MQTIKVPKNMIDDKAMQIFHNADALSFANFSRNATIVKGMVIGGIIGSVVGFLSKRGTLGGVIFGSVVGGGIGYVVSTLNIDKNANGKPNL